MALKATPNQVYAMMITERVTSIFSLLGILFILSTFLLGRGFDKPINRLFFFASFSNLGMNIAALIAEDGVSAGQNSSLCQFQAFAIQWFLGVDTLWALCMGFNVYLALFRGWTTERMRRQEWKYFLGCYGCSFIPALVYLLVNTNSRGKVYGPALLWCWIVAPKWDFLRIATLYGIVWVALIFAWVIYVMAFNKVWNNRHQLQGLFNPFNENPFEGIVTTEIDVTTCARRDSSLDPTTTSAVTSSVLPVNIHPNKTDDFSPYSVNIEVGPNPHPDLRSYSPNGHDPQPPSLLRIPTLTRTHALHSAHPESWLYARAAFLFFCALLISWVPSSANRLYALVHPDVYIFGLNYTESLVLPLQGFWNALVYIITSQTACRHLWRAVTQHPSQNGAVSPLKHTNAGASGEVVPIKLGNIKDTTTILPGKTSTAKKPDRPTFPALGGMRSKGGDSRLERFASRRTSQRLESDESSFAGLGRGV